MLQILTFKTNEKEYTEILKIHYAAFDFFLLTKLLRGHQMPWVIAASLVTWNSVSVNAVKMHADIKKKTSRLFFIKVRKNLVN